MNKPSHELTKGLAQSVTRRAALVVGAGLLIHPRVILTAGHGTRQVDDAIALP